MELEFCHGSRRENIEKIEKRVVRLKIIFLYFGEKETSPVNNEDSQNKNSLVVTGYARLLWNLILESGMHAGQVTVTCFLKAYS